MKMRVVFDRRVRCDTCFRQKMAARTGVSLNRMQVNFPFEGNARVIVAYRRELPLAGTAGRVQMAVMVPWAPEADDLAFLLYQVTTMCWILDPR